MSLQVIELVLFAGLAAIVLFMLYSVLGRRVGRQPQEEAAGLGVGLRGAQVDARAAPPSVEQQHPGLAALKAKDPGFELAKFLDGARGAYEQIVRAFVGGDRAGLKGMVQPAVFEAFEPAIAAREARGETETVEFVHPPRADFEDADVSGALARLRVRFLAELRQIVRKDGADGDAAERRTAEIWTFERSLEGRDSSWLLARVDAAEA
ncbi:MAG: TIM44-related membrane protein TimA [Caulobacteraceae bacterium]|nr:TIM44-related membrane protein TimA [Caulobacter sp.]